ncbi:DUF2975 domain-containing protein [Sedimentibacter hydroxybenzoicus DSM 7310]|uniref:DUF2975 domain-containing protein n=1 Tax=Sedimentibacter hydroxybenzoicus DSM 7310 TaxID=1123245 RepID=A0A974GVP2_SEDHY|nr:DUF2975 domain-containing protein [Sedimentibacter hydroxybenzoicus]NYB73270.1 DUF2975 domain-containing protein [Sedimentibacter hydroxybenzoicus DSM 7310]
MYQKSIIHYMTKICIDILFFAGIICCAYIPFSSRLLWNYYGVANQTELFVKVILLCSGICCVYILWQLKVIFKTLLEGNPFIHANVACLRKISISCLVISIIYLVKMIFMPTISTIVIIAIFVVGCLLCLTLKDLFKQSIYYKDENDLTV